MTDPRAEEKAVLRANLEWAVGVVSTAYRQVLKSGRPVSLDPAGSLFAR